ncbi:MAG TPA: hypothetical protein VKB38_13190 [Terracidiphilus sp.]|nr:hypothetical protein [Terracidiphilus sp.]
MHYHIEVVLIYQVLAHERNNTEAVSLLFLNPSYWAADLSQRVMPTFVRVHELPRGFAQVHNVRIYVDYWIPPAIEGRHSHVALTTWIRYIWHQATGNVMAGQRLLGGYLMRHQECDREKQQGIAHQDLPLGEAKLDRFRLQCEWPPAYRT